MKPKSIRSRNPWDVLAANLFQTDMMKSPAELEMKLLFRRLAGLILVYQDNLCKRISARLEMVERDIFTPRLRSSERGFSARSESRGILSSISESPLRSVS